MKLIIRNYVIVGSINRLDDFGKTLRDPTSGYVSLHHCPSRRTTRDTQSKKHSSNVEVILTDEENSQRRRGPKIITGRKLVLNEPAPTLTTGQLVHDKSRKCTCSEQCRRVTP